MENIKLKFWDGFLQVMEVYNINYLFLIMSFLYLPFIYFGKSYMKKRKIPIIDHYFFYWNSIIGTLSFIGTLVLSIRSYNILKNENVKFDICDMKPVSNDYYQQLIIFIYCSTKIFEWIDTAFLILKKKKILFLHWFHHLATMLYCWFAMYHVYDLTGYVFCFMNLIVHTIMYFYYALKSKKIYVPKFISILVTILQVSQMFIGVYAVYLSANCQLTFSQNKTGIFLGFSMYSVYFYLFFKILLNYFF